MSDVYSLLKAGSTVTGDTWTMINNLGLGTGMVVSDLEGTVIDQIELSGVVSLEELSGVVELEELSGEVTVEELEGKITNLDIEGEVD